MKDPIASSKSERTRQFIIEKVAPVFNMKGYAGTSLSDLTTATGLTKGAIYGNFKNKDEVAVEAFRHNLSRISAVFIAEMAQAVSPVDKVLTLPVSYRKIYQDIAATGGCPILNTATDTDDTHPQLRQLVQEAVKRLKKTIEGLVEEGVGLAQIREGTDGDKVAGLIIALVEGGFLVSRIANDRKYFENALEQVEKIINELRV